MWLGGTLIPYLESFEQRHGRQSKKVVADSGYGSEMNYEWMDGHYHRSMRPVEPEAVFGDIKYDHGFKRFRLKGMAKVNVEFGLVALAHNLRKYARVQTLEPPVTSEPVVADFSKTHEKVAA